MSQYREYGQQDDAAAQAGDEKFLGVNARLSPEKLPPGMMADGVNVRMRTGEAETRLGVAKPGWLNVTDAGAGPQVRPVGQFYGSGVFKDPNSRQWVLLAADGGIFRCRPHNARFAMPLPTGVKVLSRCAFVQAFSKVFCFRGKYLAPLVLNDLDTGWVDIEPLWSSSATYNAFVQVIAQAAQEVAYGPFKAVSALTSSADLATVVTTLPHGYVTGADITITGASHAAYNGRFNITVVDEVTFTYHFAGAASPDGGTVKCSNMSSYWKALGSKVTLTSLTSAAGTATATKNGHGFTTGQYVTIAGANETAYNGVFVITVTGANTFTYAVSGGPASPATGTITAQTSLVLAGQSPDTNPEAWQQIYNVLPNADDALFINNQLLVPTALQPGASTFDATSVYTKKDFIAFMDIGDNVHVNPLNIIRANQGDDGEIVCLVKYNQDTVVVLKERSWGVLTGVTGDLSTMALDMRGDNYGACALRSGVVAGKNVLFPSTKRGICSLVQNELGQTRSVDIPFSNDFERVIQRINWNFAAGIRLAWWDDKLYVAVPLDGARQETMDLVPDGATYNSDGRYGFSPLPAGTYDIVLGPNEDPERNTTTVTVGGLVVGFELTGTPNAAVTAEVHRAGLTGVNNAVLVFDFRIDIKGSTFTLDLQAGEWQGYDTGEALTVLEWFKADYNGLERLFYIAADGYANLYEESWRGDRIAGTDSQALGWEEIEAEALTRGYDLQMPAEGGTPSLKRYKRAVIALGVWDAKFSIAKLTGAAGSETAVKTDVSFSRMHYIKPAGKADFVEGNVNGDFAEPGRGNYSVALVPGGNTAGVSCGLMQEVLVRPSVRTLAGRYGQFRVTNRQGRMAVKAAGMEAAEGQRKSGVTV